MYFRLKPYLCPFPVQPASIHNMKKLLFPLIAILLFAASCKDDFKVAAPYKTITVVYGMINRDDTAHYFRIEKAFMDENKSAIELAAIPDSSFFDSLTVTMKEYFEDGTFIRSMPLYRVDLNQEGYPKDAAGFQGFFTAPSYAYKLKIPKAGGTPTANDSLEPFKQYRLIVYNAATKETDSTDFLRVVNSRASKNNPSDFYIAAFGNASYTLSFAKTDFRASTNIVVNMPKNAKIVEGIIRFHIVETNAATGIKTRKAADFHFDSESNAGLGEDFSLTTSNSAFYGFLRDELGTAGANITRQLDSCDIFIYAGSYELYNYMTIANVQNSSLLGDQIKPVFTNIRGANAQGLVASKALRAARNIPIDDNTIDSIKVNAMTKDLAITGRSTE